MRIIPTVIFNDGSPTAIGSAEITDLNIAVLSLSIIIVGESTQAGAYIMSATGSLDAEL